MTVPSVDQAEGSAVSVQLQARGHGVPADNMLSAVATYASVSGEPRTASLQAGLSNKSMAAWEQGLLGQRAQCTCLIGSLTSGCGVCTQAASLYMSA